MAMMLPNIEQFTVLILFLSSWRIHGYEFGDSETHVKDRRNSAVNVCNMSLSEDGVNAKRKQCNCDHLKRIVDCSDLEIKELPSLISFPKTVQVANFGNNKITDIRDDTFYHGSEIVELDLSNNRIDFMSIASFTPFHNVRHLTLRHNALWTLPPGVFEPLSSIQSLDLSFNDLSDLRADIFKEMTFLKVLKLSSNPLHKLESDVFEHTPKIEKLDLSSTLLEAIPDTLFTSTPNLKVLNLANSKLVAIPTEGLKTLKKLKILNLSGNDGIKVIGAHSFYGLRSLSVLYLDRMQNLEKIDALAFGELKLLTELHCSYNYKLSEIHEDAFVNADTGERNEVNQLFLRQNNLERLPLRLQSWSESSELDVRNNPWNCDCRSQWLLHLKIKSPFLEHVQCAKPPKLEGQRLSELEEAELECHELSGNEIVIISCALAVAVILAFLVLLIVIHRRNFKYDRTYFQVNDDKNDTEEDFKL